MIQPDEQGATSRSLALAFARGADETVGEHRSALSAALGQRDRLAVVVIGGVFLVVATAVLVLAPAQREASLAVTALYVAIYAAVSRVEFEVFTGASVPTQLVFVPMLFVLPLGAVPLAVAVALMLGSCVDWAKGRIALERVSLNLIGSWHAVGPVLVLGFTGAGAVTWADWPLYTTALVAQFTLELAAVAAYEWITSRTTPVELLPHMGRAQLVDAILAATGLVFAFAAQDEPFMLVLVLPLVVLLRVFAHERRARIDNAIELSTAYRGTAFLLGDVIEADDSYTGAHSRDVVTLSLAVADELGLPPEERRDCEFVALLHDVGKIRIPAEIINKPGKLDADEWAIMKTHTIAGEQMLEQIGGLLGNVGGIVRSCHEHWNGGGYPDGLAGDAIPRIARIVMCCDAFSAMTTDRSYRAAMPEERAIEELHANSGTQFDPAVVDALTAVIQRGG